MPTWTQRTEPDYEFNLFSTQIVPPNPQYYPFSTEIQNGDKGYFIFKPAWNTPNWVSRTIPN